MHIEHEILHPDGQRYAISFPEKYSAREPVPLILALHYAGHGTAYYGRTMLEQLVQPALHDLGAFIIAPDCPSRSWCDPHSEKFILALLDFVSSRYPVDLARVLVAGYSMGGNGAWCLAASHPDRFSAAVVISGWPPEELDLAACQVPIYAIHSQDDEFVPIEATQKAVEKLVEQGGEIVFKIVEGITHFEVYRFINPLKETLPWVQGVWENQVKYT